ncbi:cytochrome c oxidase copper chaperone-like [Clavelina lepadiformis]|uniref:Cytochrome c oxidase copper chaperone n=1 Tax=Clavelina lepadiformis TaxID=159417 RepID=A0ABP0FKS0_CLALP
MSDTRCTDSSSKAAEPKPDKRPRDKDGKLLKPCCVCLETKGARDECIINKGEESCGDFIEAHKKCLRDLGFNI